MALVINNNSTAFNSRIFLKFDSIPRENDLREMIQDCCSKHHDESGDQRPNIALALLRQQIKLRVKNNSDVANALREFVKTFNQSEIKGLFSLARPAFDEMGQILRYYEDFESFIDFFDSSLIKDDAKLEAFLLDLLPDIWGEDNWFELIRRLISIKSKKTEEIVTDTIKDVERFRGSLAEDYFKTRFYTDVFDLCNEHDYKDAMAVLFTELGSYYFYSDGYYLESLPTSMGDFMFWHGEYAQAFEAGYFGVFVGSFSKGKEYKYSINLNKSWFSKDPKIQDMINSIEEHNSKINARHYESFLNFDRLLPESEDDSSSFLDLDSFNYHLFSNEGFTVMSQDYQAQFKKNIEEFLERLITDDQEIPLDMAYEILSKEYLKSLHPMIYGSIGDHKKDPIALMKRIVLKIYLGKDCKSYSKLLIDQINQLDAKEKAYFKEMFLTQGSGIRAQWIMNQNYLDSSE